MCYYHQPSLLVSLASPFSALFSGISALVAVGALLYTRRYSRQSRNIDLILKFSDRFDSDVFMEKRRAAALSIHNYLLDEQNINEVREDIFDFFETVGLMFRRYKLDEELVWNTFFEWVQGYWQSAHVYITKMRKENNKSVYWEEFEFLYRQLVKVEQEREPDSELILSDASIIEFLKGEERVGY
jgi:hypothetical protein